MNNPFSLLEFRARVSPENIAYSDGRETLNFQQLHLLCVKASEYLASMGVTSGDKVYLLVPEHVAFILSMALFHRGCVSCVGLPGTHRPTSPEFQWTLSAVPSNENKDTTLAINSAWFEAAVKMPGIAPAYYSNSELSPCRIVLTSGTTGGSKAVVLSPDMIQARLRRNHLIWSSQQGNEINMMGQATIGGFMSTIQNIEAGRAVLLPATTKIMLEMIRSFYVVSIIAAPANLVNFINENFVTPESLAGIREVRLAGSTISSQLVTRLLKIFKAKIYGVYGSTEIGAVGMVPLRQPGDSQVTAIIQPDIEVEIVTEGDVKVEDDSEGIVRIKGTGMAHHYAGADAEANTVFRDGWFYPGDIGKIINGAIYLTGRTADVINLGGIKIHPFGIEQVLCDIANLEEVAAFSIENADGRASVAFAYIASETINFSDYRNEMLEKLPRLHIPEHYFRLTELPRNAMGKVLRRTLSTEFSREIQKRQISAKQEQV